MNRWLGVAVLLFCLQTGGVRPAASQSVAEALPIGVVQGTGDVSPFVDQVVAVRGIVVGQHESRNQAGVTYYTLFIQDAPEWADGDPATSDGLAIFLGRSPPQAELGDELLVTGRVTEFYGLTEIAGRELTVRLLGQGRPLPPPVELQPPTGDAATQAAYFEPLEGMRVALPAARVVGPTHPGCGFAVVRADSGLNRVFRHALEEPLGPVVPVLHHSNVDCTGLPAVAVGDEITGLVGPLTYHFDRYKLIPQPEVLLAVSAVPPPAIPPPLAAGPGQFSLVTFNLENYFDAGGRPGDPVADRPTPAELARKQAKLAHALSHTLGCPTLVGVQEVENGRLLQALAEAAAADCGFTYAVAHRDSPDARGIDVGLLSDPRRVAVQKVALRQGCTRLPTGIVDAAAGCPRGQAPLFSRPPLQVDLTVDGHPHTLFVNHFKSKRGGARETAPERLAQAAHLNGLVGEMLAGDPDARIIVLGDFNDYLFSPPLAALTADGRLTNLLADLPAATRYSFIFDGESQLIDGILVSPALLPALVDRAILHVNADFPATLAGDDSAAGLPFRATDHDLPLVVLQLPALVEAAAPGPWFHAWSWPAALAGLFLLAVAAWLAWRWRNGRL